MKIKVKKEKTKYRYILKLSQEETERLHAWLYDFYDLHKMYEDENKKLDKFIEQLEVF